MGLDMYLNAKVHLLDWKEEDLNVLAKIKPYCPGMRENSILTISYEVAYWRKVNWVHGWMERQLCGTKEFENCAECYVSRDTLKLLKIVCEAARKEDPQALHDLRPVPGFFFGSMEQDEYYFKSLEYTADMIDRVLKEVPEDIELYYQANW